MAKQKQTALEPVIFNTSDVRTQTVNDEIWFNLKDVCKTVGYANYQNALRLIEEDDQQKLLVIDAKGRRQNTYHISEAGLYQFLGASNVPKARPFKRWVSKEVIPSIRKSGAYSVAPTPAYKLVNGIPEWTDMFLQEVAGKLVESLRVQVAQQAEIKQLQQAQADLVQVAVDELLARQQAVEANKPRLHDLVRAIVAQAKSLPKDDPEACYYSTYANTWRTVHRHAQPPVSALKGYTSVSQIEHAVLGAESILIRMGGKVVTDPVEQLKIEFAKTA